MSFAQGDLIVFDFSPTLGHEPTGRRPSLVVSSDFFNASTSMTMVCPITSTDNGFPLHFKLPDNLKIQGFIVSEQVRGLDLNARQAKKLDELDCNGPTMKSVLECIRSFF